MNVILLLLLNSELSSFKLHLRESCNNGDGFFIVIFICPCCWLMWLMITIYELLNDVKSDRVSGYFMSLLSVTYTLEDGVWQLIILIWNIGTQLWRKIADSVAFYDLRNRHMDCKATPDPTNHKTWFKTCKSWTV